MSLLDAAGDIDDALVFAEPVEWAKDPLNLTPEECQLRLIHVQIKHNADVPFNPSFKALPRAHPPRPCQLKLPEQFTKPTPLDFFKLFFGDEILDILVYNTNEYAMSEVAGLFSRHWASIDRHELSIWIGLNVYIGLHGNQNIKNMWSTNGQVYH
jgi:hypothetical protein